MTERSGEPGSAKGAHGRDDSGPAPWHDDQCAEPTGEDVTELVRTPATLVEARESLQPVAPTVLLGTSRGALDRVSPSLAAVRGNWRLGGADAVQRPRRGLMAAGFLTLLIGFLMVGLISVLSGFHAGDRSSGGLVLSLAAVAVLFLGLAPTAWFAAARSGTPSKSTRHPPSVDRRRGVHLRFAAQWESEMKRADDEVEKALGPPGPDGLLQHHEEVAATLAALRLASTDEALLREGLTNDGLDFVSDLANSHRPSLDATRTYASTYLRTLFFVPPEHAIKIIKDVVKVLNRRNRSAPT